MSWQLLDDEVRTALLEVLRRRPYLELDDIQVLLLRESIRIDLGTLSDALEDTSSPFYAVPERWAVNEEDPELAMDEDASAAVDEAPEEDEEGEEEAEQEESDDGYPARWIGPDLRDWQLEAINAWFDAGERGIVQAITGTGKTLVGVFAAASALDYGYKVAITVPTLDLMDQWIEELRECIEDVNVGRLGDGHHDSLDDRDVLVSTIASGSRHYMRAEEYETLLITDEVHRMGSENFQRALEEEAHLRLGLTATLERNNDTGVEDVILPYFGSVVYTYGYADALKDGVLAPFRLGLVAAKFSDTERAEYEELGSEMGRMANQLRNAGAVSGDGPEIFAEIAKLARTDGLEFRTRRWAQKFVANLGKRRKIQSAAVDKFKAVSALKDAIALAERALVFTETREAAQKIADDLKADGIEAFAFDSSLDRTDRSDALNLFREGHVQVLCAPRVLDEGIDVPDVDVGVIVSASQSRRQMIQRLGRIVRPNAHGRPSSLFIIYLEGTREDPAEGGHEGFLNEVEPHALATKVFLSDTNPDLIAEWSLG